VDNFLALDKVDNPLRSLVLRTGQDNTEGREKSGLLKNFSIGPTVPNNAEIIGRKITFSR